MSTGGAALERGVAGPDAFHTIFILYLTTSLLGALITTRVEPWPASDEDAHASATTR